MSDLAVPPKDPRVLHTGEGKVLVGLTVDELTFIAGLVADVNPYEKPGLLLRLYTAIGLLQHD